MPNLIAPPLRFGVADLVDALDDHGQALASADAHRLDADGLAQRLQIVDERRHDPCTGLTERVTERDRATVRVQLVRERVDADVVAHRKHLSGERFVQLDDVDVTDLHVRLRERLLDGLDRADAHDAWVESGYPGRDDAHERRDAERLGLVLAHHHDGSGSVVQRARVPGRYASTLRTEHRLELLELLERRARARAVVLVDDGAVFLRERNDLASEEPA